MTWGCINCERENPDTARRCAFCTEPRPAPVASEATEPKPACVLCGDQGVKLMAFHDDTPHAADRSALLCASCWIPALRRRQGLETRESRCREAGCEKTVAEHIREFEKLVSTVAHHVAGQDIPAAMRDRPTLLERKGIHRPRNAAVAAALGKSFETGMTVEELRAAELREDKLARLAEAERQTSRLREWAEREGVPWRPAP